MKNHPAAEHVGHLSMHINSQILLLRFNANPGVQRRPCVLCYALPRLVLSRRHGAMTAVMAGVKSTPTSEPRSASALGSLI
jgi:hypothetical protein